MNCDLDENKAMLNTVITDNKNLTQVRRIIINIYLKYVLHINLLFFMYKG